MAKEGLNLRKKFKKGLSFCHARMYAYLQISKKKKKKKIWRALSVDPNVLYKFIYCPLS